uniref:RING-type domain-containing protein n=1 Tax=Chromera velia CCMP2878 TaxID=1169474 RepID=A0A0G4IG42_9ALVE|mmetsp:Transcript_4097/g.8367  ORF Transcript_4097/g.8367 Transcript_4097/m.8367 type:complete len:371 (+) Transcript_4097:171-1283(+)|eukprot:Cvel_2519.t1-p1 / transcript=Cvel_2519.t1 / gene=Cvel_2519 / organism=Chromera_velia_CCMP2878 / gene_product=RING finger and CHY zinc finger domain-containing, putative / transcript_product=RING finger and CHY zinc finger domain-containing, putative / location=Cvel_scaffold99:96745-101157(+) / protein_length=370 / sequence_SO=supercontig / SO=protein_coding / is_pseudo=false
MANGDPTAPPGGSSSEPSPGSAPAPPQQTDQQEQEGQHGNDTQPVIPNALPTNANGNAGADADQQVWEDIEGEGDEFELDGEEHDGEDSESEDFFQDPMDPAWKPCPRPGQLGCPHYERKCKIVAPCCGELFWCRHCHNAEKNENEEEPSKAHEIDRKSVTRIVCQLCHTEQDVGAECTNCGERFALYFCGICKFWDNRGDIKKIFHCKDCGICRVGGAENFFHCKTCGSCYPRQLENHTCIERAMHQDCPICLENLFESIRSVAVLQCGHTIHQECLRGMTREFVGLSSLRCPVCSASICKTEQLWAAMDRQVEETPMPADLQYEVSIICNDCHKRGSCAFHIYGHKCPECGSYNTRRTQTAEGVRGGG